MSVHDIFPNDDWVGLDAWQKGGPLGLDLFNLLSDAGYSDNEAAEMSMIALELEPDEARRYIGRLAADNGF